MFPSPCSGLVPVASSGFGQASVWSGNWCGGIRVDAVIAGRCIAPGNRIDIVLCEVLRTPSLVCFAPGGHVVSSDGKAMRNAHVLRMNRSAQTPRRLCRRSMTSERSSSLRLNAGPGSDGLAPVKDFTRHSPVVRRTKTPPNTIER